MTVTVPLTKGLVTVVDDDVADEMLQHKWHAVKGYATYYASRFDYSLGTRIAIKMHRQILGVTDPTILVDHIDRDGLNNLRNNLCLSNKSDNAINSARVQNAKGVYYDLNRKRYKAFLLRPKIYVGTFLTEESALKALAERR